MRYRRYDQHVMVNGISFNEVWIDPYSEAKHFGSITDELILRLVRLLNETDDPDGKRGASGFRYWATDLVLDHKSYRLVWLMPPDHLYLGVRNAFRQDSKERRWI